MAYKSYNKLWESEFDGIVSKGDKLQVININQLKLEVHDTFTKDKKITISLEPTNPEDIINEKFQDESLSKIQGQISYFGKHYNQFKLEYNKQSMEEILVP